MGNYTVGVAVLTVNQLSQDSDCSTQSFPTNETDKAMVTNCNYPQIVLYNATKYKLWCNAVKLKETLQK